MSPPAVNWPPAPVRTTNRAVSSRVELGEDRGELVARSHRDAVELPGDVERDRRDRARRARPGTRRSSLMHLAVVSSRSILRRIFPDALFGSESTRRYSRGRLKRASGGREAVGVELLRRRRPRRRPPPRAGRAARPATPITATSPHAGMRREDVLDLERMHVLAAGDDHVVDPAVDPEVAVARRGARCRPCEYQPSRIAFASASGRFQ